MIRRKLLGLTIVALAIVSAVSVVALHAADTPRKHKIVYQLTEPERVRFVLGNIQNHVNGVGGWQNIEALELVVFGPALEAITTAKADPGVKQALETLQGQGLVLGACGNTMRAFHVTLGDLPKGARELPQGGVVRVMELQEQGYAYIRP